MADRIMSDREIDLLSRLDFESLGFVTDSDHPKRAARKLVFRWKHLLMVMQRMTPHERRKHFDMGAWGNKTPCGTVACLGGHASLDPWFRKRGFVGVWEDLFSTTVDGPDATLEFLNKDGYRITPDEFFGEGAAIMFQGRGNYQQVKRMVARHLKNLTRRYKAM